MDGTGDSAAGSGTRLHHSIQQRGGCRWVTMHIATSVQQLATFPMSGRPGRVPGTREWVISNSPFVVAYSIEKEWWQRREWAKTAFFEWTKLVWWEAVDRWHRKKLAGEARTLF